MLRKYKIIDSLIFLVFVLALFLTTLLSYFFIKNKVQEYKIYISQRLSSLIQKDVVIKDMTPIFFNGIKLSDLSVYDKGSKNPVASIHTVKIYLKIKDVILRKVTLDKSVSRITLKDFNLNLREEDLRIDRLKTLASSNASKQNGTFKLIFYKGKVRLYDRIKRSVVNLVNRYSRVDLEDGTFHVQLQMFPEQVAGFSPGRVDFSLDADGQWGKDLSISGVLNQFHLNRVLLDTDLHFTFVKPHGLKSMKVFLYTDHKKLSGTFDVDRDVFKTRLVFRNFDLFPPYNITGTLQINRSLNHFNASVNLSSRKGKEFLVQLFMQNGKWDLKKLKCEFVKGGSLTASGTRDQERYSFTLFCDALRLGDCSLHGKMMFDSSERMNRISLFDFSINDFRIHRYVGQWEKKSERLFFRTLNCSEKVFPSAQIDLDKNAVKIDFSFEAFALTSLFQLFREPSHLSGFLQGTLSMAFHDTLESVDNDLKVILKNHEWINFLYLKSRLSSRGIDTDYRIVLNNQKELRIQARSHDLMKVKGEIIYDSEKWAFEMNRTPKLNGFNMDFQIPELLKLDLFYQDQYNFLLKLRSDYKKDLVSFHLDSQMSKRSKEWNLEGQLNFHYAQQFLRLNFHEQKGLIYLNDILVRLLNKEMKGQGTLDLARRKINIELPRVLIKGDFVNNKLNCYFFINKLLQVQFDPSGWCNVNGFLNLSGDLNALRFYSDLDLYDFHYHKFYFPNIYTVLLYENKKVLFKKLAMEYQGGKLDYDVINFYRKMGEFYSDGILKINNIVYDKNLINGKLYLKFMLDDQVRIRIKVLKLLFNELALEDMTEDLFIQDNKVTVSKESDNGLEGFYSYSTNSAEMNWKLTYNKNSLEAAGGFKDQALHYTVDLKNLDLEYLAPAFPAIKNAEGRLHGRIKISGLKKDPVLNGFLTGEDIQVKLTSIFKKIKNINFNFKIENNYLVIQNFKGLIGNGGFSLIGKALLKKFSLDNYDLQFKTTDENGIYLEKRENDIMGNVRTSLVLKGSTEELGIAGKVILDKFDFTWPIEGLYSSGGHALKLNMNLDVIAGKKVTFYQDSNNLDIKVKEGGRFHITGDLNAKHKVIGKMEAEKGTIDYFGTTFNVVYATVSFAPYYFENTPWISAKAEADVKGIENEDVLITMTVEGRAYNDLTPVLSSSPALTPREIFLLLNDSAYYVSDNQKNKDVQQKEINELIKRGFIQIFDSTYRTKLITPLERRTKRILGLDLLKIRSSLVKNLLEPKLYKIQDNNSKYYNPLADTQLTVGKYITDSLLFKYSVILKQNPFLTKLNYEHQFGIEWRVLRSLNFEWMYLPLYYENYSIPMTEQTYKLEWKRVF